MNNIFYYLLEITEYLFLLNIYKVIINKITIYFILIKNE